MQDIGAAALDQDRADPVRAADIVAGDHRVVDGDEVDVVVAGIAHRVADDVDVVGLVDLDAVVAAVVDDVVLDDDVPGR